MIRKEITIMDNWEFALVKANPVTLEEWERQKGKNRQKAEENVENLDQVNNAGRVDMPQDLTFEPVNLPHDWAVNMPFDRKTEQGGPQGFRDRWGIGWYRKRLVLNDYRQDAKQNSFLEFGGVYENCTVWINGTYAGSHKYGYSTFRIDITDKLISGENEILVKVDNTITPVDRWYSGCGIYRTVKLVTVPACHLDPWNVVVQASLQEENTSACVTVHTGLQAASSGTLTWKAPLDTENALPENVGQDTCESFQAASDSGGRLTFHVPAPKLWSAEDPNLYELTLTLYDNKSISDEITIPIGIREIYFDTENGMTVNGIPTKLKGVCLHQEAGCAGIAADASLWRERLLNLKKLGCNAIRAAHHTFSEEFLALCDELGFYVYEECFDKWKGGLYGRYFDSYWEADVAAMVKRDRNHPSIVIWGVGNEVENQAQSSMLEILKMLTSRVRELDASRPVTYAMNPHFKRESNIDLSKIKDIQKFVDEADDTEIYDAEERVERIAAIAEYVDLVSCNYQEQWYDLIHKRLPDKPILGTEVYEYFKGHYESMQNFSQENPSLVPMDKDYCIGSFIWTGYDYFGESMGWPAKGWSGALIRTNNVWRPVAYILQSYWSSKPMIHFSVMDYSLADEGVKEHWDSPIYADHWHFPQFNKTVIPYIIACNCEEAALFLNGKRFYLPRPKDCPNGIITGFLPWIPGEVEVIGYNAGKEVCRHTTATPDAAAKLTFEHPEYIEHKTEQGKLKLLTVRAEDMGGRHYFRENGRVGFSVEGPAVIKGVDNGDITGNEPLGNDKIHLYQGRASVLIEFTGEKGRVTVNAYGSGLRAGRIVLNVV